MLNAVVATRRGKQLDSKKGMIKAMVAKEKKRKEAWEQGEKKGALGTRTY